MRVHLVSPSNARHPDSIEAVRHAAGWARRELGWDVTLTDDWGATHPWGGAGAPEDRARAIAEAMGGADLVFCSGGGDHASSLLEHLHPDQDSRGAFVGTSDNSLVATVLAAQGHRTACGPDLALTASITDPSLNHARTLDFPETRAELALLGTRAGWSDAPIAPSLAHINRIVRPGEAEGPLVAANLRCLLKAAGTPYWPAQLLDGAILCVEDAHGDASLLVAELVQLAQLGTLERIAGLVIGWLCGFDPVPDSGLEPVLAAALDLTADRALPIQRLGVFGHRCPHMVLPIGAPARLRPGGLSVNWDGWRRPRT